MTLHRATLADASLATLDEGHGSPVLLVHGFPLSHAMWLDQVAALRVQHRVLAPDLRGFGASTNTADAPAGSHVTMDQFADDLAALLDVRGVQEPVTLIGLSMGGYIAWSFYRRHRARLRALVLCDTRSAADTEEVARGRGALAARVLREGPGVLIESMFARLVAAETPTRLPVVASAVRAMIEATPAAGAAAALRGMALRSEASSWLGSIDLPVLVIVGESDAISPPEEMRSIATAIPGARLAVIPRAGHLAPMENPAAVNQALAEFLDTI